MCTSRKAQESTEKPSKAPYVGKFIGLSWALVVLSGLSWAFPSHLSHFCDKEISLSHFCEKKGWEIASFKITL
jgi:hypothetical protein